MQAALNNFFKIENLSALRETALRQVAEDVEVKRLVRESTPIVRRDEEGLAAPAEAASAGDRRAPARAGDAAPESERVIRRAWRSAQRLDAPLDVLLYARPDEASREDRARLESLRRLVSMLGARLRVEEDEDVAAARRASGAGAAKHLSPDGPSARGAGGLGRLGEPL